MKVPKLILDFFIMLFVIFYTLKDGKNAVNSVMKIVPLKEKSKTLLAKRFSDMVAALIYGIVVVAIIQGAVATAGFYIFGIPSPLFWGLAMTILSILPFIGAWLVWFPAALLRIFAGDLTSGVGLMLYGILIVSTIDNLIRPKLVGIKAKVHPLVILLGVVGGISLFGIIGIIIGPLLLGLLLTFLTIYRER